MLQRRPPLLVGVLAAALGVALTTLLVYALKDVAPVLSLGVVYLLVVLGVATLAFNFFHIPPTGRFTIANGENWVGLIVFFVAAVGASSLAELARKRTQ